MFRIVRFILIGLLLCAKCGCWFLVFSIELSVALLLLLGGLVQIDIKTIKKIIQSGIWNCDPQMTHSRKGPQEQKTRLTFRNLSSAPLVSNVSFPCSSIVTAASLAKVTPEQNGCPGLLQNKQLFLEADKEHVQIEYNLSRKKSRNKLSWV